MTTVPHPVPTRIAHHIAALFGHEDDTLIAWQQACVQAAEALHQPHDPERLRKALALAQGGHVAVADGGVATVNGGATPYTVQADGTCTCPDYAKRGAPCKHVLAVLIHVKAQALLAPSASPAPQPAAPPAPAQPTPEVQRPSADRWHVTEAPASCSLRLRVGELELLYTMRDVSDAALTGRVQHLVPWVQDVLDQARERQGQLDALRQQRETAQAAQAVAPVVQPPLSAADLHTLLQQTVQQALAVQANGHATAPTQEPAAADDQATGVCSLHQVAMQAHEDPETGDTWHSHWLEEERRYCRGRRPSRNGRRNGRR